MSHKAETHKPGTVSRVFKLPEVKEEQAEVRIEGTDPLYGKIRIVNFLADEIGNKHRLKEGDGVDVVIRSDETEPKKP
jgi:hypothetical protein